MSDSEFEHTIVFTDTEMNNILNENLTKDKREKQSIRMVEAIEEQLNNFEMSQAGLDKANLLQRKMAEWFANNAEIIMDDDFVFLDSQGNQQGKWQEKFKKTYKKLLDKIAEIHKQLDEDWAGFMQERIKRTNYNALKGGRRTRRKRRRKGTKKKRRRKSTKKKRRKGRGTKKKRRRR